VVVEDWPTLELLDLTCTLALRNTVKTECPSGMIG
jgi:hypothetical protein